MTRLVAYGWEGRRDVGLNGAPAALTFPRAPRVLAFHPFASSPFPDVHNLMPRADGMTDAREWGRQAVAAATPPRPPRASRTSYIATRLVAVDGEVVIQGLRVVWKGGNVKLRGGCAVSGALPTTAPALLLPAPPWPLLLLTVV